MPVKTASWRQRSEPRYRKPTMSPRMSLRPKTPRDQKTIRTRRPSPTAKDPSLSTAQTVNHPRPSLPQRPSNVSNLTAQLLPIESPRTKKTITVTKRRRAKRTIWNLQLQFVILNLMLTPEGTTVPPQRKVRHLPRSAPPQPVKWTVPMTMVRQTQWYRLRHFRLMLS